ncbi:transcription elongation factor GreA [candidate division CPR3 bacterium 4484_211]|uniref:Transcription elongation factor GreA n=1 Tax=candidate division CPR3 bacterium 4484_211 TaxID=1968527 RepID=A0A1W9NWN8_UNCC3|nr:MAG: transcription elongation factor GreA [candidate division CPR3 bacterium 4484_211]
MPTSNHIFTPSGYQQIKNEYWELSQKKRPEALKRLKEARGMGNLEDNLQYDAVKSELELIDARIAELEEVMKNAKIVQSQNQQTVGVGSSVTVEIDGEKEVYTIVNPFESEPTAGKISYESPVGKALMNKKVNDEVVVNLPHATLKFIIVKIE